MTFQFRGIKFDPTQIKRDKESIKQLKQDCVPSEFVCIQTQQSAGEDLLNDEFLEQNGIKLSNYLEKPIRKFKEIPGVSEQLLKNISIQGWLLPSFGQQFTVSPLLNKISTLCIAPTGSGKSAAFLLPIIIKQASAVVVSPTEELSQQTQALYSKLSNNLNQDTVTFATPDSLATLQIGKLDFLVLDECDCLLSQHAALVDAFITRAMKSKPTCALFSASLSEKTETLISSILQNPAKIVIRPLTPSVNIQHKFVYTSQQQLKLFTLLEHVATQKPPILIFSNAAQVLHSQLKNRTKWQVGLINEGLDAASATDLIGQFNQQNVSVLVLSPAISRGIDFMNVNTVINFDVPSSVENYIHQVGRAGRQRAGVALTFLNDSDRYDANLKKIAENLQQCGIEAQGWCDFAARIKELEESIKERKAKARAKTADQYIGENKEYNADEISDEMYADEEQAPAEKTKKKPGKK